MVEHYGTVTIILIYFLDIKLFRKPFCEEITVCQGELCLHIVFQHSAVSMFLDHGNKLIIKLLVDGLLLISEAFRLEFQLPKDSTSPPSLQVSFPPFRFVVEMRVDHLFRNLDSRNIQLHLSGQEIARIDGCWFKTSHGVGNDHETRLDLLDENNTTSLLGTLQDNTNCSWGNRLSQLMGVQFALAGHRNIPHWHLLSQQLRGFHHHFFCRLFRFPSRHKL